MPRRRRSSGSRRRRSAEVERVAHLVLMQLLPALVEGDLGSFGAALPRSSGSPGAGSRRSRAESSPRVLGERWCAGWRSGAPRAWDRAPGGRRCTGWWGASRAGRALAQRCGSPGGSGAGFRGGICRNRGQGLAGRTPAGILIDSSFCRMYTGPSKPPAGGDLAGSERGFGANGFRAPRDSGTGSISSGL